MLITQSKKFTAKNYFLEMVLKKNEEKFFRTDAWKFVITSTKNSLSTSNLINQFIFLNWLDHKKSCKFKDWFSCLWKKARSQFLLKPNYIVFETGTKKYFHFWWVMAILWITRSRIEKFSGLFCRTVFPHHKSQGKLWKSEKEVLF